MWICRWVGWGGGGAFVCRCSCVCIDWMWWMRASVGFCKCPRLLWDRVPQTVYYYYLSKTLMLRSCSHVFVLSHASVSAEKYCSFASVRSFLWKDRHYTIYSVKMWVLQQCKCFCSSLFRSGTCLVCSLPTTLTWGASWLTTALRVTLSAETSLSQDMWRWVHHFHLGCLLWPFSHHYVIGWCCKPTEVKAVSTLTDTIITTDHSYMALFSNQSNVDYAVQTAR